MDKAAQIERHPSDPKADQSTLVTCHVLSRWSRGPEGNETEFSLDAERNGWPTRIVDVVDQPVPEIKVGHGVIVEVLCTPATLATIDATGRHMFLDEGNGDDDRTFDVAEKQKLDEHAAIDAALYAFVVVIPCVSVRNFTISAIAVFVATTSEVSVPIVIQCDGVSARGHSSFMSLRTTTWMRPFRLVSSPV